MVSPLSKRLVPSNSANEARSVSSISSNMVTPASMPTVADIVVPPAIQTSKMLKRLSCKPRQAQRGLLDAENDYPLGETAQQGRRRTASACWHSVQWLSEVIVFRCAGSGGL